MKDDTINSEENIEQLEISLSTSVPPVTKPIDIIKQRKKLKLKEIFKLIKKVNGYIK